MTQRDLDRIDNIDRLAKRSYEVHMQKILVALPSYYEAKTPEEKDAVSGAHNMLGALSAITSVCRSLRNHPGELT